MAVAIVAFLLASMVSAQGAGHSAVRYTAYYNGGVQITAPCYDNGYGGYAWYRDYGWYYPQRHDLQGWSGWYGTWGPRYQGSSGRVKAGAW
jgi:hypothetical protein